MSPGQQLDQLGRQLGRLRPRRSLQQRFDRNEGRLTDKWLHYFDIYERHFEPFRNAAPRVLEIGVSHGGSLELWRAWLGRGTRIVGLDIDERAAELAEPGIEICVGDQSDRAFLQRVIDDHGPFDIVIDDGSHQPAHQLASLETLWPAVAQGGVYLVEDLHANYWSEYGGGLRSSGSFMEFTKSLIDDLHAFHSETDDLVPSMWTRTLGGLHVYDSVVVLDRVDRVPPTSRKTGRPTFETLYGVDVMAGLDEDHLAQIEQMNRPHRRVLRALRTPVRSGRRFLARHS